MRFFTICFEFTKETSFANENDTLKNKITYIFLIHIVIMLVHVHKNSKPILYMKEITKKCSQINNF